MRDVEKNTWYQEVNRNIVTIAREKHCWNGRDNERANIIRKQISRRREKREGAQQKKYVYTVDVNFPQPQPQHCVQITAGKCNENTGSV